MSKPNTPEWHDMKAELARRNVERCLWEGHIDEMMTWILIEEENVAIAAFLRELGKEN